MICMAATSTPADWASRDVDKAHPLASSKRRDKGTGGWGLGAGGCDLEEAHK
jgi:hypothetical protein